LTIVESGDRSIGEMLDRRLSSAGAQVAHLQSPIVIRRDRPIVNAANRQSNGAIPTIASRQ
jgi:hypothetical protein